MIGHNYHFLCCSSNLLCQLHHVRVVIHKRQTVPRGQSFVNLQIKTATKLNRMLVELVMHELESLVEHPIQLPSITIQSTREQNLNRNEKTTKKQVS